MNFRVYLTSYVIKWVKMAKVKNKRNSGLADKVHTKKKSDINKKKINPFEVHVNKEKIKVLGKKSKHDRGLPGVSRAKAIQKVNNWFDNIFNYFFYSC